MTVRGFLWVLQLYIPPTPPSLPIQTDRYDIAETTVASHVYDPYNDPSPIFFPSTIYHNNCVRVTLVYVYYTLHVSKLTINIVNIFTSWTVFLPPYALSWCSIAG
jgi:hypothetical protein